MSLALSAPTDAEARAKIEARVQAAGTSFYWAMRLLPAARRQAMFAVYAFCREVDDIADDDRAPAAKRQALSAWRREIDGIYAGHAGSGVPGQPIGALLLEAVRTYRLRREDFIAVIDGMEMDAATEIRAPAMAELDLYCARVASAVGHLSVRIFGADTPAADEVAEALGRALQLTNILRDIAEDAARGRLYLPRELLLANGITGSDPASVLHHPGLPPVCTALAELAQHRFVEARAAMARCPPGTMRPAAVMGAVYHALLKRLVKRGWTALDQPVRVSKPVKLWLALRHGLL